MPDYKVPRPVIEAFERIQAERDSALAEYEELGKRLAELDRENSALQSALNSSAIQVGAHELKIATLEECLAYFRDTLAALQAEANLTGAIANAETARIGVRREAG